MLRIATLVLENGIAKEKDIENIDLNRIKSKDPIAFIFGQRDKKNGIILPNKSSKEYKLLAKEYIRGFNSPLIKTR